ncbi:MAG: hypothetical protein ABII01_00140 [Candidatus Woesearchaeota archaeon]
MEKGYHVLIRRWKVEDALKLFREEGHSEIAHFPLRVDMGLAELYSLAGMPDFVARSYMSEDLSRPYSQMLDRHIDVVETIRDAGEMNPEVRSAYAELLIMDIHTIARRETRISEHEMAQPYDHTQNWSDLYVDVPVGMCSDLIRVIKQDFIKIPEENLPSIVREDCLDALFQTLGDRILRTPLEPGLMDYVQKNLAINGGV